MNKVVLVSNGDFRDAAGVNCWPMQDETLKAVRAAFKKLGVTTEVLPKYNAKRKHGFVTKQKEGADIFAQLDPKVPVVVVLSCWAYAHHVCGPLERRLLHEETGAVRRERRIWTFESSHVKILLGSHIAFPPK